jgi:hypothetical protein
MRRVRRSALAGVVLLALAPPAWAIDREGAWRGETSQGRALRFTVDAEPTIRSVRLTVEYENDVCAAVVRWDFGVAARIADDGTFRIRLVDELDERDLVVLKGEFLTRRRAEGTFRSVLVEEDCGELRARGTWVATRVSEPAA